MRGWREGVVSREGRDYEVGVMWHFWVNAEMERNFMMDGMVGQVGVEEKVADRFQRELRAMGAERVEVIHCHFVCLPG